MPVATTTLSRTALPTGFTHSGLGTDYSQPSLKFDTQDDWLQLFFSGTPGTLTFDVGVNGTFPGSIPSTATFTVQESVNGSSWTTLGTYTNVAGGTKTLSPLSTTRYLRWYYTIKPTGTNIALYKINLSAPACTAPTQASSLSSNNVTTDGFNLGWTVGNGDGTMLVVRPTAQANQIPANGTAYTPDLDWAAAGQINTNNRVVFRNSGATAGPVTGLSPETRYTVTAYGYNTTGNCYNLTSPPSSTQYTLSPEPSSDPSSFSASAVSSSQIDLGFPQASLITNADGYIILGRNGISGVVPPSTGGVVDGIGPDSWSLPLGTTKIAQISNNSSIAFNHLSLTAATTYCYSIIPYNWDLSKSGTFNYKINGPPLTACATTLNPQPEIDIQSPVGTSIDDGGTRAAFGNVAWGSYSDFTFRVQNTGTAALSVTGVSFSGTHNSEYSIVSPPTYPLSIAASGNYDYTVRFTPAGVGTRSAKIEFANDDANEGVYDINISGTGTPSNLSDIIANATYSYNSNIEYIKYQNPNIANSTTNDPVYTNNSIDLFKFDIRDGGGAVDADNLPTILSAITFNVTNLSMIRDAALFNGNGLVSGSPTIDAGAGTIAFSGLSGADVTATDINTRTNSLILRVSFNSNSSITDNAQIQVTISNANVTAAPSNASSLFKSFTSVVSSSASNNNKIEVIGTALKFLQQPTTTGINVNMSPAVTVGSIDVNLIQDLDLPTANVTVECSTPAALTGNPVTVTPSGAVATFSSLEHTIASSPTYTLTATCSGMTAVTSSPYVISNITYPNNSFLSTAATGSYSYTNANTWSKCGTGACTGTTPGLGGWDALGASGQTPTAGSTVFIQGKITYGASVGVKNVTIFSGGELVLNSGNYPVEDSIRVKSGGKLRVNDGCVFELTYSTSKFIVEDNAEVHLNRDYTSPSSSLWQGTEDFYPQSNFYIYNWREGTYFVNNDVSISNTHNDYMFGNLYIDAYLAPANGTVVADYNNYGFGGGDWNMLGPLNASPINFLAGNLVFVTAPYNTSLLCSCGSTASAGPKSIRLMGSETGTFVVNIHGDIELRSTWSGTAISSTDGNYTLNVDGNVNINGGSLNVKNSTSTNNGINTMNIAGNLTMTGTTSLYLNPASLTNANGQKAVVNLKGNLTVNSTSTILNGVHPSDAEFNFTGTSPQLVDVASILATTGKGITFDIKSGATVQLKNNDFSYNNGSTLTVENGGTLDFNWKTDGTPLVVKQPTSPSGSNFFTSSKGSTLKITSLDGLYEVWDNYSAAGVTVNTGNLQGIPKSNRDINPFATFWFVGKFDQKTGDCINPGLDPDGNGRQVICELASNSLILTPTVSFAFTSETDINTTGGKLDIRSGKFIETESAYINGSDGTLYMSPGTLYKIVKGNSTINASANDKIPRMSGTTAYPYILNGGTIELAGTGSSHAFQTVRADDNDYDYQYLKFSGSNTYDFATKTATTYKNLSSQTTIDSALIISGDAVVDCISGTTTTSSSFVGDGALFMDGGRLRIKKIYQSDDGPSPQMKGINVAYSCTGGTVEFYGTNSVQKQKIRGLDEYSTPRRITYYKIDVNATAAKCNPASNSLPWDTYDPGNVSANESFNVSDSLKVNAPAFFRLDTDEFIGGSGSITVFSGAGFIYGSPVGIKTSGTGTGDGNIRVSGARSFSKKAYYGFGGTRNMVTGNALPDTVAGLFIFKTTFDSVVTLSAPCVATDSLILHSGKIKSATDSMLTLGNGVSIRNTHFPNAGGLTNMGHAGSYVIGPMGWISTTTSEKIFPIGSYNIYGPMALEPQKTNSQVYTCRYYSRGYADQDIDQSDDPKMDHVSAVEYWTIASTAANADDNAKVTFFWRDHSQVSATPADWDFLCTAHFDGNDWNREGDSPIITPASSSWGSVNSNDYWPSFSPGTLGTNSPNNPLPIELLSFDAKAIDNTAVLTEWVTASELNNDYFTVERSKDGIRFEATGTIPGAGNSIENLYYQYTDTDPYTGISYYRLQQTDYDGTYSYSDIKQVFIAPAGTIFIYPNPASDDLFIDLPESSELYTISLYDVLGRNLFSGDVSGTNQYKLSMKDFATGAYLLEVKEGEERTIFKIVKNK